MIAFQAGAASLKDLAGSAQMYCLCPPERMVNEV
jgi:hypothetical protein